MNGIGNNARLSIAISLLLLVPSLASAATIKEIDQTVEALKSGCQLDVEKLLPSSAATERENYSYVQKLADQCGFLSVQTSAHFANLGSGMKDDQNKAFVGNVSGNSDPYVKRIIAATKPVRDAANSKSDPKDALADLAEELDDYFDFYDKLRPDVIKRYNELEREAQDVSRAWNDERKDDEEKYKYAIERLDSFLATEVSVVKRGAELVYQAAQSSKNWAEANRSGDQAKIEDAYKRYFLANKDLDQWLTKYEREFELLEQIPVRTSWTNFIEQTKKSFQLYDGKVSVSNLRLHEYGVHVMGY